MYAFQRHELTAAERSWIQESSAPDFSVRAAKVKLRTQLPRDFQPEDIDPRLYALNQATPIGLWHLDPDHPILKAIDATMRDIRKRILSQPTLTMFTVSEIAQTTGLPDRAIGEALSKLSNIGAFFDQATMSADGKTVERIELRSDTSYDNYLNYEDLDQLLENFYLLRGQALRGSLAYSQSTDPHAEELILSDRKSEAENAIYIAIETAIEYAGRAYIDNVPQDARNLLVNVSGGTINSAEADELTKNAIANLSAAGKIEAPLDRSKDWKILIPWKSPVDPPYREHSRKVFIVHGRDDGTKQTVARFVEKLGLEAVILHERPNLGRTIISKFREESTNVGFAVVLMTPDDLGRSADSTDLKARARQNVVFELGYFIGRLQPDRVVALVKGHIERPSDFDGVVYISLEDNDWRILLAKEFRASGMQIDGEAVL